MSWILFCYIDIFDDVDIDDVQVDCAVHVGVDFGFSQVGADVDVDVGIEGDTAA